MKPHLKSAMLAAAQLTAAGDLQAATAAIRQALAGDRVAAPTAASKADSFASATPEVLRARMSRAAEAVQAALAEGLPSASLDTVMARASTPLDDRMVAGSFTASAGSRDYLLYLPGKARPSALVVMLHGCTQTAADFAAGTAMNEQADRHGFAVLYPAQSKVANRSACWNWFLPRDQRAGRGEPAIIAAMAREVAERHEISSERLFVAGLSAGGAMAAILGTAYPDLFAAIGVHSGLRAGAAHDLESALAAMKRGAAPANGSVARSASGGARKPLRTIVFHGRQDRTVHPSNARQVTEAALAAFPDDALGVREESGRSAGGRSFIRTVHADERGVPMVELWEVKGAGHAWSGGTRAGSHTDPLGPDASEAMAAFFLADPRRR